MKLSKILYHWEIIYDVLKNKWKDGRHYADTEQMRSGFIALYEHVDQLESSLAKLEARNTRLKELAYYEGSDGNGYGYKDMCENLEEVNEEQTRLYHLACAKISSREAIIKQLSETELAKDVAQLEAEIERLRERINLVLKILPNEETEAIMVLMAALEGGKKVYKCPTNDNLETCSRCGSRYSKEGAGCICVQCP